MNDMYNSTRRIVSHIAAMSAVYGVTGTLPARARILELGCGKADILMAHALAWPESECVGIDLEPQTVFEAEMQRQKLGAENVALHAMGLDALVDSQPGEFDYIIINGLFSLLPETERAALLAFAARCLSANGIVALRWNCLPGSRDAKTLQDAIALHSADATDDEMTLSSARAMLVYLELSRQKGRESAVLNTAIAAADNEFMLRYVHNFNDAVYLVDFHQQVTENGFQYVGDSFAQSELAAYYGSSLDEVHSAIIPGKGKILSQQYLDFAINREARFSLLVPAQRHVTISDLPDVQAVENLHWAGCFKRFIADDGGVANAHITSTGQNYATEDPLILSIIDVIGDAWPLSVSFEQIVQHTLMPEEPEQHREKVREALTALFVQRRDGLLFSYGPSPYNVQQPVTLIATPGLLADSENGGVNLWGQPVTLNDEEKAFLRTEIKITDKKSTELFLALREKGAIFGGVRAWKKAFQDCLKTGEADILRQLALTLLLFSCRSDIGGFLVDDQQPKDVETSKEELKKLTGLLKKANTLVYEGKNEDVRSFMDQELAKDPDNIQLLTGIVRACLLTGAYHDALRHIARLLSNHASNWDFYYDFANALTKTKSAFYAGRVIRFVLRNNLENGKAWDMLACLYRDHGNVNSGLVCARKAVKMEPKNPHFLTNLGTLLSEKRQIKEARKYLKKAVELSNNHFGYFSNYLFVITHDPEISAKELFREHATFGREVDEWAKSVGIKRHYKGSNEIERKLRIGFVSGDFLRHPVSNFFTPFWDAMDRTRFDLVGYNASPVRDEVTDYLENGSALWRDVDRLSDIELAEQIYEDKIDILIDLSGHTTYCRLPMFGLRPAPVQMTWIGYPGTTGMKAIDYRILPDTIMHVPDLQEQFCENLLFVPMEKTFEPFANSPDVNALPALSNDYFTFGSFNRPKKINNAVLSVWADILVRLPAAKFLIGFMDDPELKASIKSWLLDKGVQENQLVFKERMRMEEYLAEHNRVDMMLDAFPYSGGTTTNHAAWMGVPTLTLRGDTLAGCQGLDIMYTYGLESFIAVSKADYVSKAIYWAEHIDELSQIRRDMRSKIPTKQRSGFNVAATFERALRTAWEMYCRGEKPRSFVVDK